MRDTNKQLFITQRDELLKIHRENESTESAINKMCDYIISNKKECNAIKNWMKENSFFTSPASTCFHGNYKGGLAEHSLLVTIQALKLALPILENFQECKGQDNRYDVSVEDIFLSCIAHDFCKAGLYNSELRNVKDENGNWSKAECFTVNYENRNLGHGNESVLRLLESIPSLIQNRTVLEAVSRHMGFSDLAPMETKNFSNFLQNPLVIIIQYADETAAAWYNC